MGGPLSTLAREEVLNFMDGRRDVQAIRDAVAGEYGPVDLSAVERFVDDLVSMALVAWTDPVAPRNDGDFLVRDGPPMALATIGARLLIEGETVHETVR